MQEIEVNLLSAFPASGFVDCADVLNQSGYAPGISADALNSLVKSGYVSVGTGTGVVPYARVCITESGRLALMAERQAVHQEGRKRSNEKADKDNEKHMQNARDNRRFARDLVIAALSALFCALMARLIGS